MGANAARCQQRTFARTACTSAQLEMTVPGMGLLGGAGGTVGWTVGELEAGAMLECCAARLPAVGAVAC